MKKPLIPVSDHAVVRYLERVVGVDVAALRAEIGKRAALASGFEGKLNVISDGFVYCVSDGVVTTVHSSTRPDLRTGRIRRERPE